MSTKIQYSQQNKPTQPLGDMIETLPSDQSVPSHNEIRLVNQLFQKKKGIFDKILLNTKDILIIGGLFVLFSLSQVDRLIKKVIPSADKSPYILLGIKTILFIIIYFIIKNIYLAKKSNPN
jgi:hypothetical protein